MVRYLSIRPSVCPVCVFKVTQQWAALVRVHGLEIFIHILFQQARVNIKYAHITTVKRTLVLQLNEG